MITFTEHYNSRLDLQKSTRTMIGWAQEICSDPKLILDIGANVGLFSCLFTEVFPNAVIHAFEPIPDNFSVLSSNIRNNNLKVTTHQLALWHEETRLELGWPVQTRNDTQNSGLYSAFYNETTIPVSAIPLDKIQLEFSPDIVKIDVEGSEAKVLLGGQKTLSQAQCIIVEKGKSRPPHFPPYEEVINILKSWQFKCVREGYDEYWKPENV